MQTKISSANIYLSIADLDKFQQGRKKTDILKDVQWRGDFLMACNDNGKSIAVVAYKLLWNCTNDEHDGKTIWAIFFNDKFTKFVPWQKGDMEDVPYGNSTRSRSKPIHMNDYHWLIRVSECQPVDFVDLKKKIENRGKTPEQTDIGLTIAWLLLRPSLRTVSKEDLEKNAELRNQFNASRLDIGMTESEVESIFKTKPLETGNVASGLYKIYGSNEAFDFVTNHFSNVLVLFQKGRLNMIYSFPAGAAWRQQLSEEFIDLGKLGQ